jgi:predicted secreted hydrolase
MKKLWFALLILALAGATLLWLARSNQNDAEASAASLIPLLQEVDTAGFARAVDPDAISFPADLGAHDDYQTEWWYYTGNLVAEDGREFGFQLTFFRRALAPLALAASMDDSAWRTNQVYLAHFTVSDIADEEFYATERFSRGAAGLAGAQAEPYRVWLEDWSATAVSPGVVRLVAGTQDVAINLDLTETMLPVLHGDGGLSVKGPEAGNASYYYSLIQQRVSGIVQVSGERIPISGLAWKDHEWSTSALSAGAVGWDWFSLQLDNGGALMFFEIRREDGGLEPYSSGTYIDPSGETMPLAAGDWELAVTSTWRSPHSDAEYPAGWRITVPKLDLELSGAPLMLDQELNVSTVYWEGASRFSGTLGNEPVSATGYVEMTGYAHSMSRRL